jgi:hypothetical protein
MPNFPAGKTNLFTYATGSPDDDLNHNLLTVTDPLGRTYLANTYGPTASPANIVYDRVVRTVFGDPGDIIDLVYVPQAPTAGNEFATIKTIVNDRAGNVTE